MAENLIDTRAGRRKNTPLQGAPRRRLFPRRAGSRAHDARPNLKPKEFHYSWEYELSASPRALWPLVADTNRFNRDAGLPDVTRAGAGASDARGGRRRLGLSKLGVKVEWEEEPFEWIRPYRFGVVRRYTRGPVAEARVSVELNERDDGGTRLVYQVWASPRGALGRAVIPVQVGRAARRKFAELFRRYDALAARGETRETASLSSKLDAGARTLLQTQRAKLIEEGSDAALVALLAETVEGGDDLTLARVRPYALADAWGFARRDVLELCLRATRAGMLELRWELLCPLCRGAKQSATTLRDVRAGSHCDSCNIDFEVDFDRSVEVVFRPSPAVRRVEAREFCVGGPQVTPHVVAQQTLAPGERRELSPVLEEGRHRLRTLSLPGSQSLLVARDGATSATLRADARGWPGGESRVTTNPVITFENATTEEQLFILERTAWGDGAATAAEVTALQLFRDLFATEALRPGERINVGRMTILFTDLRASTRLYREIGDAVAFGTVMNHFDVLRAEIAREGGSIVKTLGDAVMAAFTRPAPALRAIMRSQAALASPPLGARPLVLKAGIHTGPCIAVTLNERLDYFGSNVNIAARLEPLSTGSDCVITSDVRRDPEVAEMLDGPSAALDSEPLETALKGFDGERFELWRVTRKSVT